MVVLVGVLATAAPSEPSAAAAKAEKGKIRFDNKV